MFAQDLNDSLERLLAEHRSTDQGIFKVFVFINKIEEEPQKPVKPLAEKATLVRVFTPFVLMLLVCKGFTPSVANGDLLPFVGPQTRVCSKDPSRPDSLTTNAVIPCRDSFSSRQKTCWRGKPFAQFRIKGSQKPGVSR